MFVKYVYYIYISHIKFSCNICTNVYIYIYIYALNKEIYIYIYIIHVHNSDNEACQGRE